MCFSRHPYRGGASGGQKGGLVEKLFFRIFLPVKIISKKGLNRLIINPGRRISFKNDKIIARQIAIDR
jgi:hypothetical protein